VVGTACFEFGSFDKAAEVARGKKALCQEMNMIGHGAVGVNRKTPCRGFRAEYFEKPTTGCLVKEYLAPVTTT
jgi:hypothetical protein